MWVYAAGILLNLLLLLVLPLSLWQHLLRYFQSSNLSLANFVPIYINVYFTAPFVPMIFGLENSFKKDFGINTV